MHAVPRRYVLFTHWQMSTTPNVIFYKIYQNGFLIATLPASATSFDICLRSKNSTQGYTITAVDSAGVESAPTPLEDK